MANKILLVPETARSWSDTGTASDELCDMGGLAADAVISGSYHDLTTSAHADRHLVEFRVTGWESAPVIGEGVDLYFTLSSSTDNFDGGGGSIAPGDTTAGTFNTNSIKNLWYISSAIVSSTTPGDDAKVSTIVKIPSQFYAPVVHNNTADNLQSTGDTHTITVTPIPPEIQ